MRAILIICILFVFGNPFVQAQYFPLNTNYMFNLLPFNPAYAGAFKIVDLKVNIRQQWVGVEGAPSTQFITFHKPIRGRASSFGGSVINDNLGPTNEIHMTSYYSYKVTFPGRFGNNKYLSFGISLGGSRISSNIQEILSKLDEKINPAFTDPLSFQELSTVWAVESGVGVMYYTPKFFVSLSSPYLFHTPFDSTVALEQAIQIFLYSGYLWEINQNITARPSLLIRLADASTIVPEISILFTMRNMASVGIAYRFQQSLSLITQLEMTERISLGYAFDYVTNGLRQTYGSHEIMLGYNLPLEVLRNGGFKYF